MAAQTLCGTRGGLREGCLVENPEIARGTEEPAALAFSTPRQVILRQGLRENCQHQVYTSPSASSTAIARARRVQPAGRGGKRDTRSCQCNVRYIQPCAEQRPHYIPVELSVPDSHIRPRPTPLEGRVRGKPLRLFPCFMGRVMDKKYP